jgi:hypothetical protein
MSVASPRPAILVILTMLGLVAANGLLVPMLRRRPHAARAPYSPLHADARAIRDGRWLGVAADSATQTSVDSAVSIARDGHVLMWVRWQSADGTRMIRKSRMEVNCPAQQFRYVVKNTYDESGSPLPDEPGESDWHIVMPDTDGELLHRVACGPAWADESTASAGSG